MTPTLKIIIEMVVVSTGAVGVFGVFQDYRWLDSPDFLTADTIFVKYFAGLLAGVSYGTVLVLRRYIQKSKHRKSLHDA